MRKSTLLVLNTHFQGILGFDVDQFTRKTGFFLVKLAAQRVKAGRQAGNIAGHAGGFLARGAAGLDHAHQQFPAQRIDLLMQAINVFAVLFGLFGAGALLFPGTGAFIGGVVVDRGAACLFIERGKAALGPARRSAGGVEIGGRWYVSYSHDLLVLHQLGVFRAMSNSCCDKACEDVDIRA